MQTNTLLPAIKETPPAAKIGRIEPGEQLAQATADRAERQARQIDEIDQPDVERLQHLLARHDITLKFTQDEETEMIVVQMIDARNGEAVRQFPTEVSLKLAAELGKRQGWIFDQQM